MNGESAIRLSRHPGPSNLSPAQTDTPRPSDVERIDPEPVPDRQPVTSPGPPDMAGDLRRLRPADRPGIRCDACPGQVPGPALVGSGCLRRNCMYMDSCAARHSVSTFHQCSEPQCLGRGTPAADSLGFLRAEAGHCPSNADDPDASSRRFPRRGCPITPVAKGTKPGPGTDIHRLPTSANELPAPPPNSAPRSGRVSCSSPPSSAS